MTIKQPTPVQLDGDGPFVTPAVQEFLMMGIFQPSKLSQLCLLLEGGKELRLPMTPESRAQILRQLADFVPPKDDSSKDQLR